MYSCVVCFEDFDFHGNSCSNKCGKEVCDQCFPLLLNFSLKENSSPMCPINECSGEYFLKNFEKLCDQQTLEKYKKMCYKKLSSMEFIESERKEMKKKLIENIIKERMKYMDEFPLAIKLTTLVAFSDKIRKIKKDNLKKIEEILNSENKKCLSLLCKGKLNKKNSCLTCEKTFCEKCDKEVSGKHDCSEEDLKSVQFIKDIVKCPECKVPVEKISGCNFITCAVCKTNFHYPSGERSVGGNHDKITIKPNETFMDYVRIKYEQDTQKLNYIKQLEKKSIKDTGKAIEAFLEQNKEYSPDIGDKSVNLYEKYKTNLKSSKKYMNILLEIQNYDGVLSMEDLKKMSE